MKPCRSCRMSVTRRCDRPWAPDRCENRMSLASVTGSLITCASMVTEGGATAHTPRLQSSPVQNRNQPSCGNFRIPMRDGRGAAKIAAETLFKHTDSPGVEPEDPTH